MRLAHQMALESDRVRADCVEATEFPDLVERYEVMGVPRTVVNDRVAADGALPERAFLELVQRGAQPPPTK